MQRFSPSIASNSRWQTFHELIGVGTSHGRTEQEGQTNKHHFHCLALDMNRDYSSTFYRNTITRETRLCRLRLGGGSAFVSSPIWANTRLGNRFGAPVCKLSASSGDGGGSSSAVENVILP